jgi:hypothetical protein
MYSGSPSVDHAAKLNDAAITNTLHTRLCTATVGSIRSRRNARNRASAGKPAVADHIKHDNSRELSGLGHDCPPRDRRYWSIKTHSRLALITSWRPDLDPAAASWLGLDGLQRAFRQQADDIQ